MNKQPKITEKDYEEYLNEIGTPQEDLKSEGGRIPNSAKYGTWTKKNDKIGFNTGYQEYVGINTYATGGSIVSKKKELQDKIAEYKRYSVNKSMPESARNKFLAMITPLEKELAELKDEPFANSGANYTPPPTAKDKFKTGFWASDIIAYEQSGYVTVTNNGKDYDVSREGERRERIIKNDNLKHGPVLKGSLSLSELKDKKAPAKKSTNSTETITQKLINTLTDIGIDLKGEDETSIAATRMELEESSNDLEVDKIIKDYEENWLTDLAKKPQGEVKKAFADYYKAAGGPVKKSTKKAPATKKADYPAIGSQDWSGTDWEAELYEELEEQGEMTRSDAQGVAEGQEMLKGFVTKFYNADMSAKETAASILKSAHVKEGVNEPAKKATSKTDFHVSVKHQLSRGLTDEELDYLTERGVDAEETDDYKLTLSNTSGHKAKDAESIENIFKDALGSKQEYSGTVKSKPAPTKAKKEATKASTSKEEYDCDELIKLEIERKAKRNESAKKTEKKPAITKNIEAIENVVERAGKQFKDGDLTKAQIIKMIAELHARIKDLEKLLKTAK